MLLYWLPGMAWKRTNKKVRFTRKYIPIKIMWLHVNTEYQINEFHPIENYPNLRGWEYCAAVCIALCWLRFYRSTDFESVNLSGFWVRLVMVR